MKEILQEYAGVLVFIAILGFLFDRTIGVRMDRVRNRRERIQTEAEKHMKKILDGEL